MILELPLSSEIADPPRGPAGAGADQAWPDYNLLRYQFFGASHFQPSVDGYSGFVPPHHRELGLTLADFPSERSLALLHGLEVGLVIVHSELMEAYQPGHAAGLRAALADLPDLVHERDFDGDWVYRLLPKTAGAPKPLMGRFWADGTGQGFLILAGDRRPVVQPPDRGLRIEGEWLPQDGGRATTFHRTARLPLIVGEAGVVPLDLPRPAAAGAYTLRLTAADAPWPLPPFEQAVTVSDDANVARLLAIRPLPADPAYGRAAPGSELRLDLGWRLLDRPEGDYSVSVRLEDGAGQPVAQDDRALGGGRDLLRGWQPGLTLTTTHRLAVPADALGAYTVRAFLYRPGEAVDNWFLAEGGAPAREVRGTLRVKPTVTPTVALPPAGALAQFGGTIYLLAADARPPAVAGEPFRVTVAWTTAAWQNVGYTVFAHLVRPGEAAPLAQLDSPPQAGRYPTTIWDPGEVVSETLEIRMPPAAAGQPLCLRLGLYDPATLVRLPRSDGGEDFWQGEKCW